MGTLDKCIFLSTVLSILLYNLAYHSHKNVSVTLTFYGRLNKEHKHTAVSIIAYQHRYVKSYHGTAWVTFKDNGAKATV